MTTQPIVSKDRLSWNRMLNTLGWRGMGAFLLSLFGLLLVIVGATFFFQSSESRSRKLRITSGTDIEVREKMVQFLIRKAAERRLTLENVSSSGSLDALEKVEKGSVDLAVIQAGLHLDPGSPVRQVAAIDVERLHLLVRSELASTITEDLKALRGRTVFLNSPKSGTRLLSTLVLSRVGLSPGPRANTPAENGVNVSPMTSRDILSLLDSMRTAEIAERKKRRADLPDACFLIASLPSQLAWRLVNEADYRLVPLPYARALSMISIDEAIQDSDRFDQLEIQPTEIPAFTYGISPAVPATPCPTLGVRTLLVAHKNVPDDAILRILPLLFEEAIHGLYRPPDLKDIVPEYPLHTGSIRYRDRNKPIVASEVTDGFKMFFSFVGPVVGFALTLYGYYRWRQLLRFTRYFREVIHLDLVVKGLAVDPHAPTDHVKRTAYLEKKLTDLQQRAVVDFCENYFRGEAIVFNLLTLLAETGKDIRFASPRQNPTEAPREDRKNE